MKCIECNAPLEQYRPGDKPFCKAECETKFNMGESPGWTEECQVCGDEVEVDQEYEIVTCGKPGCHDKIIGRWGV